MDVVLVQSQLLVLSLDLGLQLGQVPFLVLEQALHPDAVGELGVVDVAGLGEGGLSRLAAGDMSFSCFIVFINSTVSSKAFFVI